MLNPLVAPCSTSSFIGSYLHIPNRDKQCVLLPTVRRQNAHTLQDVSPGTIQIDAEPDDLPDSAQPRNASSSSLTYLSLSDVMFQLVKVTLTVRYSDKYPDVLPSLSLDSLEGSLEDHEIETLLNELSEVVCIVHYIFCLLQSNRCV